MPEAIEAQDSLVEYGFRRVIITITAILCALLEIVDTTIVNVALNDMRGSLGATLTDVAWVITAYAIANVIIIPMTSWLSKQFGRRNYFAVSIVIFTFSSFLCGNATNIWELVDNYSWPYIFYINIPIGIIATILTIMYVRSPKYGEKLRANQVDWWGIVFLTAFIGSLQFVLEHGQQDDWFEDHMIVTLSVVSAFGLVAFIWRELVYKYPIVNLRVLRNTNLWTGTIMTFILGFGLYGSTFVIPIYTQSILGWTATDAGLLLIPSSITTGLMMPIIGKLLERGIPAKYLVAGGFIGFSSIVCGCTTCSPQTLLARPCFGHLWYAEWD